MKRELKNRDTFGVLPGSLETGNSRCGVSFAVKGDTVIFSGWYDSVVGLGKFSVPLSDVLRALNVKAGSPPVRCGCQSRKTLLVGSEAHGGPHHVCRKCGHPQHVGAKCAVRVPVGAATSTPVSCSQEDDLLNYVRQSLILEEEAASPGDLALKTIRLTLERLRTISAGQRPPKNVREAKAEFRSKLAGCGARRRV